MNPVIFVDGQWLPATTPVATADSRALRYGDGLFETLKVREHKIINSPKHFHRFYSGLKQLQFRIPAYLTQQYWNEMILELCQRNEQTAARVRLAAYRANGTLFQVDAPDPILIAQSWPLSESCTTLNKEGLVVGLYTEARKSCDKLANLKSANYLPYIMAAFFARENNWNDALILNQHQRIADSCVANLFWSKNETIFTPPLGEAAVAGTMRATLLELLPSEGLSVCEAPCTPALLANADEVFLSNALNGIRWVKQFEHARFPGAISTRVFHLLEKNALI